jgi:hypothetical protein
LIKGEFVLYIKDFIPKDECAEAEAHFLEYIHSDSSVVFGDYRLFAVNPNEEYLIDFNRKANKKITELSRQDAYLHNVLCNYSLEDKEMPPHFDIAEEEHKEIFASVVYLSDENAYDGGEIYFPNDGISIKPERGSMVMFYNQTMYHGVKKVTGGNRSAFVYAYTGPGYKEYCTYPEEWL